MNKLFLLSLCILFGVLDAKTLNRNPTFEDGKKGWFGQREIVEVTVDEKKESVLRVTPDIIGNKSFSPNSFKRSNYSELKVSFTYRAAGLMMGDFKVQVNSKSPDLIKEYAIRLESSREWVTVTKELSGFEWHDRISVRFFCEDFTQGEIQFKEILIGH
ncbi:hypothetical protein ACWPKO_16160 [Coraliomargarita sp. W4R53]